MAFLLVAVGAAVGGAIGSIVIAESEAKKQRAKRRAERRIQLAKEEAQQAIDEENSRIERMRIEAESARKEAKRRIERERRRKARELELRKREAPKEVQIKSDGSVLCVYDGGRTIPVVDAVGDVFLADIRCTREQIELMKRYIMNTDLQMIQDSAPRCGREVVMLAQLPKSSKQLDDLMHSYMNPGRTIGRAETQYTQYTQYVQKAHGGAETRYGREIGWYYRTLL